MKHAPSYFEFNAGQPQVHIPAASRDVVEFVDATVEVQTIDIGTLTPEQRAAYDRAFK